MATIHGTYNCSISSHPVDGHPVDGRRAARRSFLTAAAGAAAGVFGVGAAPASAGELSGFPMHRQPDQISCGPTCCSMVLGYYGRSAGIGPLKTRAGTRWLQAGGVRIGMTFPRGIENALEAYGLGASVYRSSVSRLPGYIDQSRPPILLVRSGSTTWHYVVAVGHRGGRIKLADPGGHFCWMSAGDLNAIWQFSHSMGSFHGDTRTAEPIRPRRCRLCGGSGQVTNLHCGICGGDGKLNGPFGTWTKCNVCGGRGRITKSCDVCGGDGREGDTFRKIVETAGVSGHLLIVPDRGRASGGGGGGGGGGGQIEIQEGEIRATKYTVVALQNTTRLTIRYRLRWNNGQWEQFVAAPRASRWHWGVGHNQTPEIRYDYDLSSSTRYAQRRLRGRNVLLTNGKPQLRHAAVHQFTQSGSRLALNG